MGLRVWSRREFFSKKKILVLINPSLTTSTKLRLAWENLLWYTLLRYIDAIYIYPGFPFYLSFLMQFFVHYSSLCTNFLQISLYWFNVSFHLRLSRTEIDHNLINDPRDQNTETKYKCQRAWQWQWQWQWQWHCFFAGY